MAKQRKENEVDTTTEEKIIAAARKVFTQKGYAATRTRDIAEEAGINLALLNYYFRSKERLFQKIMAEKMKQLFSVLLPIINNDKLTLDEKLENFAENYINLLIQNPDLPIFIISEVRANPEGFKNELQVHKNLKNSSLAHQIRDKRPDIEPVQFIVSFLGMTIFPFLAKPILFADSTKFDALMKERKILVVKWMKAILEA